MVAQNPYGIAFFTYDATSASLSTQMITDMQAMGLSRLRVQLPWAFIDSNSASPGSYAWTGLDDIVSKVNAAGLYITFVIEKQPTFYTSSNAGAYTGTISSGGGVGSTSIVLTASANHLYQLNSFGVIVSGGGNPPEIATIAASYTDQSATIPLGSGLKFGGRTTVQWYAYPDPTTVSTFATALATRYDGTHGHGFIDQYEVGNEEWDSQGKTDQTDSNTILDYGTMYGSYINSVSSAIKTASSTAKVGMCALWWNQHPHITNKLTNIYAAGTKTNWDYTNFHFYPYEGGTHGQIDPVRPCYGPQASSIIPTFPQQIDEMAAVMATNSDSSKPVYCTEIAWYTNAYPDTRANHSSVSTFDVQSRNYFITLDVARKGGLMGGYSFYTLDYATTSGGLHSDTHGNHYSDGDSLVQIGNTYVGSTATPFQIYLPAFFQVKAYIARWNNWNATSGTNGHTLLAFDSFIGVPQYNYPGYPTFGAVNPNQRINTTGSFGTPSCTSYANSKTSPNTSAADWIHYGSGVGTKAFQNDEGQLTSSNSATDYFRLGTVTAVNQELVFRINTATSSDIAGVCARLTGSGTTDSAISCYQFYVQGTTLYIAKKTSTGLATLASTTISHSNGAYYYMRFSVTGTTSTVLNGWFWACDCGSVNSSSSSNSATVEPTTPTLTYTDASSPITAASGYGFAALASSATAMNFDTFMATQPPTGSSSTSSTKDASTRMRLRASTIKDIAARLALNLSGTAASKYLSSRAKIAASTVRDLTTRMVLSTPTARILSMTGRVRTSIPAAKNLTSRLRMTITPTQYAMDTFATRTVTGSFGVASDGVNTWTTAYSDAASNISVGGNVGKVASKTNGTTSYNRFIIGSSTVTDTTVLAKFTMQNSADACGLHIHYQNTNNWYILQLSNTGAGFGRNLAGTITFSHVYDFVPTNGTTYWLKCVVQGNNYSCKVWDASTTEPTFYNAVITDTSFTSGSQGVYFYPTTTTAIQIASYNEQLQPSVMLDTATRLRLAGVPLQNLATRLFVIANTTKNLVGRARFSVSTVKNIGLRAIVQASIVRNLTSRFSISASQRRDVASRAKFLASTVKNISNRAKLSANALKDTASRLKLSNSTRKDVSSRAKFSDTSTKNVFGRVRLLATAIKNVSSRAKFLDTSIDDLSGRAKLSASTTMDLSGRANIAVTSLRNLAGRAKLSINSIKDLSGRANIAQGLIKNFGGRVKVLAQNTRDLTQRLRISSAMTRDLSSRAKVSANTTKDTRARANIAISSLRNIVGRAKISANTARDIATRIRIILPGNVVKDLTTRFMMLDNSARNLAMRVDIAITSSRNLATRLLLKATSQRDIAQRLLVSVASSRNMSTRFTVIASTIKNVQGRAKISAQSLLDVQGRAKISANTTRDASSRAKLNANASKNTQIRTKISASNTRDISSRARIKATSTKNLVARLIVQSQGLGHNIATRFIFQDKALKNITIRLKLRLFAQYDLNSRLNLAILRMQDITNRLNISVASFKNVASRLKLLDKSIQNVSTRAQISANSISNWLTRMVLCDLRNKDVLSRIVLAASSTKNNVFVRLNLAMSVVTPSTHNVGVRLHFASYPIVNLDALNQGQGFTRAMVSIVGETEPIWQISIFDGAKPTNITDLTADAFILRFSNPQTCTDFRGNGAISIVQGYPGIIQYQRVQEDVQAPGNFNIYLEVTFPGGGMGEYFIASWRVVPYHFRNMQ